MRTLLALFLLSFLGACASGSSSSDGDGCDGSCARQFLTETEVDLVLRRAVAAADALGLAATFALTDRTGNVLALYQMPGASTETEINGRTGARGGLEGLRVPAALAAISKAGTASYLSSQGNAFSTRTASQIIQEHFNPGELNQPGGPLFGVQFSQLPCSDLTDSLAPKPLPLGLSADPGGIPLYKEGDIVGGIGVELDGFYSLDREVTVRDIVPEELIAVFAAAPFAALRDRRADRIFVLGKSFRFSNVEASDFPQPIENLPDLEQANFVVLPPFFDGNLRAGVQYGTVQSGIVEGIDESGIPVAQFVHSDGTPRFPVRAGDAIADGAELSADEVQALLRAAMLTANRTRAGIRRPLDTAAQVTVFVTDTSGNPLGVVRSADAPVFGIDVALQKARTAAFFSSPDAGQLLTSIGFGAVVQNAREFVRPELLTGASAFTTRSTGNLSRPLFPDGIRNPGIPGPFSLPLPEFSHTGERSFSPFNTGLQLDLIFEAVAAPLAGIIPSSCTHPLLGRRLQNGPQIFPGSVPLYRGSTLIGAIGVSGDGIDQDDLIAFYSASRRGLDEAGRGDVGDPVLGFQALPEIRADRLNINANTSVRLRYVNCPEAPFRGEDIQNVCEN